MTYLSAKYGLMNKKSIFGLHKSTIFKGAYHAEARLTDFAFALAKDTSGYLHENSWIIINASYPGCHKGSGDVIDKNGRPILIFDAKNQIDNSHGIRPAMCVDEENIKLIKCLPSFIVNQIPDDPEYGKVATFEYGEYPQTIVEDEQIELEEQFQNGKVVKTRKVYSINSPFDGDGNPNTDYSPIFVNEYFYQGKKYVRLEIQTLDHDSIVKLIDEKICKKNGNVVWVRVEPIKWLMDLENNIIISKEILTRGISYHKYPVKPGSSEYEYYENTKICYFFKKYFASEIIPSNVSKLINSNNTIQSNSSNANTSASVSTNDEVGGINMANNEEEKKVKEEEYNPYGLDFKEVSEEELIRNAVKSGISVFLHGKSSDGKSARVKQIDPDCVILYLRNETPETLTGKSVYNADLDKMIDIKPAWLVKLEEKCAKEPDKLHILFFDEISNALPTVQSAAFNIVLDGEVNGKWKLPANARIVAAGNEIADSLAANQIAEPLFNRFAHVYIKTSVEKWLAWAEKSGVIHPAIYDFIACYGEAVLRTEFNEKTLNADPRKWEMASRMLNETHNPSTITSLVGEEITNKFVDFCTMEVIALEDVISGECDIDPDNISKKVIYASLMNLSQVDEQNLETVREFVKQLGEEYVSTFDALWTYGDKKKIEIIDNLKNKDMQK
ncbi:MAG: ATP-binding protein [Bacilli bacterium]|nr:ATP-binding protein [Bacilli bacterium]